MWLEHFLITSVNEANLYLAACLETREAALIDAAAFEPKVVETARARDLKVRALLVTHDHYDHTGGVAGYLDAFPGCEVIAGSSSAGGCRARATSDNESFRIGRLLCRALALPGHTRDSVAYYFTGPANEAAAERAVAVSVLFSGDALFAGSVGGTAGASDHQREIDGIRTRIFTLPESTVVYPGHGPATTVGIEKRHNPFF
jgi:glyoxylase-like metal-dependent hydrolase (beta-lactamase superfamily II)